MFLHTSAKRRDFGLKKSHSRLFRGAFASLGTLIIAFVFVPYIESLSNSYATKVGSLTHVDFNIANSTVGMTIDDDSKTASTATASNGQYVLLDSVVKVTTNAPAGYELYLTGYDNNFTAEDDTTDISFDPTHANEAINIVDGYDYNNNGSNIPSAQTLVSTRLVDPSDSSKYIAAIDASIPSVLSTAQSNWGYALASGTTGVQKTGFSASYTNANIATGTFLPVTNTSQKIVKTSHADTAGVSQTIYYGVYVGANTSAGTYTNSVIYTAVIEAAVDAGAGNLSVSPLNGLPKSTLTIISDYDSAATAVTASQIKTYVFSGSDPIFSGNSTIPTNVIDTCETVAVDNTYNGNNKNLKYTCDLTAENGFTLDTVSYGVVTIIDNDTAHANWASDSWTYLTSIPTDNPGTDIQDEITTHQPGVTYNTTTNQRIVTTSTLNTSTSPATVDFTFAPETAQGASSSPSTSLAAKAVENGSLAWLVVAAAASTTAMWVAVVALKDDDDEEE